MQQAKESRDKVYGAEKKSDADRQQADLSVQRAELKVRELEAKRDGTGVKAMSDTPAPPLTGAMGDDAITLRNAEISVLDAQLSRDKTYNDPDSTSLDKEKADLQVFQAQNSLEATKKRVLEDAGKTGTDGLSLKDRMKIRFRCGWYCRRLHSGDLRCADTLAGHSDPGVQGAAVGCNGWWFDSG
ncbi:hypothetical protein GS918_26225 [Rhodococcus hoagii]|nr:hypothetical protein [Prescottella equi]